jgi:hypothetical protein
MLSTKSNAIVKKQETSYNRKDKADTLGGSLLESLELGSTNIFTPESQKQYAASMYNNKHCHSHKILNPPIMIIKKKLIT